MVVDGDPVAEPGLLLDERRIWLVIQGGRPVAGAALEAELADVPALGAGVPPPDPAGAVLAGVAPQPSSETWRW